jgi:hypothetical protein
MISRESVTTQHRLVVIDICVRRWGKNIFRNKIGEIYTIIRPTNNKTIYQLRIILGNYHYNQFLKKEKRKKEILNLLLN